MKNEIRIAVELQKWVDGEGYQYTENYLDEVTKVVDRESCDFSFWEPEELPEGEDIEVVVSYYDIGCEEPFAVFKKWNSEF